MTCGCAGCTTSWPGRSVAGRVRGGRRGHYEADAAGVARHRDQASSGARGRPGPSWNKAAVGAYGGRAHSGDPKAPADASRRRKPDPDLGWPDSYDDDGNPVDMLADPSSPKEPRTGSVGYARRLIHVYGDRLRYVPAWRRWLLWDGTRWAHDDTGQVARWMKSIARRADRRRAGRPSRTRTSARSCCPQPAGRVLPCRHAGALTLASTEPEMAVSPDQLDADPFLLKTAERHRQLRTLELRAATIRSRKPADQR